MMPDREKVISEFERWCDEMEDGCPVICLLALDLLKEQETELCDRCGRRRMKSNREVKE